MKFEIIPVAQQALGAFDGGRIREHKPIGFPQEGGHSQPFSTLFYWADAWSEEGGLIDLHPHKGFEIMSYVLEGSIEHYDTHQKRWIRLTAGDMQIIRSGNGISHAEKILPGGRIFQIWFDPDLSQSLYKAASYSDYRADQFLTRELGDATLTDFCAEGSPLKMDTPAKLSKIDFEKGSFSLSVPQESQMGAVVVEGKISIEGKTASKGDFIKMEGGQDLDVRVMEAGGLFCIFVPQIAPYSTYASQMP